MMKTIALIASLLAFTFFNTKDEVKAFGFYSNEKSNDGNHSIGYTLQLWKYKGALIGQLSYNEAEIGSNARGLITNVKYNPTSKLLSFDATLNQQKISFKGKILSAQVLGTFTWSSHKAVRQSLKSCCKDAKINTDYPTLAKWKEMWQSFKY
jgi:hypothetical protein